MNRIHFGVDEAGRDLPWVGLAQIGAARLLANHSHVPLALRLHYLALGFMNRIGHAEFSPGELARLLKTTPDTVTDKIRCAKRWAVLGDESCSRCLVIPSWFAQRGLGSESCGYHGIGERYRRTRTRPRRDYRPALHAVPDIGGEDTKSNRQGGAA